MQNSENKIPLKKFAIIMRTCNFVSHKYPFSSELEENKQFHFENIKYYASINNADLFVICDTNDDTYFQFVNDNFHDTARVVRSFSCSNGGSFAHQIKIASELAYEFVEIAEDDFVKFGKIDFHKIKPNQFYTAYQHPLHDRFIYKTLMTIFNNEFTTVCSFLCNRSLLIKNLRKFSNFGKISDAETWRMITTPWWLQLLFNIKNGKFSFDIGNKYKISQLNNVTWIHIAKDSLPQDFQYIKSFDFRGFKENMDKVIEK